MDNKLKVAVLISGTGSNLKALIKESENKDCPYSIQMVLSNKASAPGLEHAKLANIRTYTVNHKDYSNREDFDKQMYKILLDNKIEFVCLAGFMRLLSKWFVSQWEDNIINIHPSLLPSFKGEQAQQQALNYGVKVAGCTVHYVTEDMDAGPIISQNVVKVESNDNIESLTKKILEQEHLIYPKTLSDIARTKKHP